MEASYFVVRGFYFLIGGWLEDVAGYHTGNQNFYKEYNWRLTNAMHQPWILVHRISKELYRCNGFGFKAPTAGRGTTGCPYFIMLLLDPISLILEILHNLILLNESLSMYVRNCLDVINNVTARDLWEHILPMMWHNCCLLLIAWIIIYGILVTRRLLWKFSPLL